MAISITDFQQIIYRKLGSLKKTYHADIASYHIANKKDDRFYLSITNNIENIQPKLSPGKNGPCYRILHFNKPIFAKDAIGDYQIRGRFTIYKNIKSVAAIPYKSHKSDFESVLFLNFKTQTEFKNQQKIVSEISDINNYLEGLITPELSGDLYKIPLTTKTHYDLQKILDDYEKVISAPISVWERNEKNKLKLAAFLNCDDRKPEYVYGMDISGVKENKALKTILISNDGDESKKFYQVKDALEKSFIIPFVINDDYLMAVSYKINTLDEKDNKQIHIVAERIKTCLNFHAKTIALDELSRFGNWINQKSYKTDDFLNNSIDTLAKTLHANEIVLHVYDQEKNEFKDPGKYSYTYPRNLKKILDRPRVDGTSFYIIKNGLSVVENIEELNPEVKKQRRYRAYIGLRLKVANSILGVLFINFHTPRHFPIEDIYYCFLYTDYCASLFYSNFLLRSLEESKGKIEETNRILSQKNEQIADFNKLVISNLEKIEDEDINENFKTQIQYLIEQAKLFTGADSVNIIEFDDEYKEFYDHDIIELGTHQNDFESSHKVIQKDEIIYEEDVNHPRYLSFSTKSHTKSNQIKSLIAAPLYIENKPIGIMWIDYLYHTQFTEEKKQLIISLKKLFSAKIYTQSIILRLKTTINAINQCLDAVKSSKTLQDLLQKLIEFVSDSIEGDSGIICLFDEATEVVQKYAFINPALEQTDQKPLPPEFVSLIKKRFSISNKQYIYYRDTSMLNNKEDQLLGSPVFTGSDSKFIVPIKFNNLLMGIIIVEATKKSFISIPNRRLLQSLVDIIAILIYDKQVMDEKFQESIESEISHVISDLEFTLIHRFNADVGLAKSKLQDSFSDISELKVPKNVIDKFRETEYLLGKIAGILKRLYDVQEKTSEKEIIDIEVIITEAINKFKVDYQYNSVDTLGLLFYPKYERKHIKGLVQINKDVAIEHFYELIFNAAKAIDTLDSLKDKSKGEIFIETKNDEEFVYIQITSNGGAIPHEKWETIFSAGRTKRGQKDKANSGTGTGLFLARRFFKKNAGNISVLNSNLDTHETSFGVKIKLIKD